MHKRENYFGKGLIETFVFTECNKAQIALRLYGVVSTVTEGCVWIHYD